MVKQLVEKIAKDKLLHFVAGVLVYALTAWILGVYALIAVVIVAIGKEVYDSHYGGTVDVYDALATMAGGLVVAIGGYNGL